MQCLVRINLETVEAARSISGRRLDNESGDDHYVIMTNINDIVHRFPINGDYSVDNSALDTTIAINENVYTKVHNDTVIIKIAVRILEEDPIWDDDAKNILVLEIPCRNTNFSTELTMSVESIKEQVGAKLNFRVLFDEVNVQP